MYFYFYFLFRTSILTLFRNEHRLNRDDVFSKSECLTMNYLVKFLIEVINFVRLALKTCGVQERKMIFLRHYH